MSEEIKNEMVNLQDTASVSMIDSLKNVGSLFYSSIQNDGTRKTQIKIYNAVNNSDESLDDHKGKTLYIKDVVAHPITLVDETTGEINECLRIVLIDKEGKGYASVSQGVLSSLQKIYSIVGAPTWETPLAVIPTEVKTRKGFKTLTLSLAE